MMEMSSPPNAFFKASTNFATDRSIHNLLVSPSSRRPPAPGKPPSKTAKAPPKSTTPPSSPHRSQEEEKEKGVFDKKNHEKNNDDALKNERKDGDRRRTFPVPARSPGLRIDLSSQGNTHLLSNPRQEELDPHHQTLIQLAFFKKRDHPLA